MEYNDNLIESWWRHCGCYDREQASGISYDEQDDYLSETDDWWESLSVDQRREIYDDFFSEI